MLSRYDIAQHLVALLCIPIDDPFAPAGIEKDIEFAERFARTFGTIENIQEVPDLVRESYE